MDLLLNYSNRFYERQFITRKTVNSDLFTKTEHFINAYFNVDEGLQKGVLTVEYLASQLNLSASYLSDALRSLTGQNAQQHIHEKLIEKAKEYLTITNLTVSEIAYNLGFERPNRLINYSKTKLKCRLWSLGRVLIDFKNRYFNDNSRFVYVHCFIAV